MKKTTLAVREMLPWTPNRLDYYSQARVRKA
jgi:hypothetical protein